MKLRELLATLPGISFDTQHRALDAEVKGLSTNSHACQAGDLFLGMPGTRVDGGDFWPSAIASGAIAAIISTKAAEKTPPQDRSTCVIAAADMAQVCGQIATAFYGNPASKLKLVGVTGTNGKTTTTHLIEFLLNQMQLPAAIFGTRSEERRVGKEC